MFTLKLTHILAALAFLLKHLDKHAEQLRTEAEKADAQAFTLRAQAAVARDQAARADRIGDRLGALTH
jgi:hypothetical protein